MLVCPTILAFSGEREREQATDPFVRCNGAKAALLDRDRTGQIRSPHITPTELEPSG
jgi:hypothetical protein